MRLEIIPVIFGILFALAGLALVADAAIPDGALMRPDRRRRPRPQRHLGGEAALGVGIACVGAALIGRDVWRYATLAVLTSLILCIVGVALNWRYVRGMMLGDVEPSPDALRRPAPGSARTAVPTAAPTAAPTAIPTAATAAPPSAATADGAQRSERRLHAR